MRLFHLHRKVDDSGVSGTGIVAEGVVFDDNQVAMRWLTDTPTTELLPSVEALEKIHGHGGHTTIQWLETNPEDILY